MLQYGACSPVITRLRRSTAHSGRSLVLIANSSQTAHTCWSKLSLVIQISNQSLLPAAAGANARRFMAVTAGETARMTCLTLLLMPQKFARSLFIPSGHGRALVLCCWMPANPPPGLFRHLGQ